ncbi:MAG: hypothetical protein ACI81Q_000503 [Paracoccaceae bacterium]|jgi:hypothetical protein
MVPFGRGEPSQRAFRYGNFSMLNSTDALTALEVDYCRLGPGRLNPRPLVPLRQ